MHLRNEDGRDLVICIDSPLSFMFYHQQLSIVSIGNHALCLPALVCTYVPCMVLSWVVYIANAKSSDDKLSVR